MHTAQEKSNFGKHFSSLCMSKSDIWSTQYNMLINYVVLFYRSRNFYFAFNLKCKTIDQLFGDLTSYSTT